MQFTNEQTDNGVTRRSFELKVAGESVPAVLWAPEGAKGPRPLILMGHGGTQHKKTPGIRTRAVDYAVRFGYATLAIDAPGHGDRVTPEQAEAFARDAASRVTGPAPTGFTTDFATRMAKLSRQAVPEWKAAFDAVQSLDYVCANGPVGYWGVSMATATGILLVADEPRIKAAVFGLAGLHPDFQDLTAAAKRIKVPVEFVFQWDDAVVPREHSIALYDALGSKEKTMHINPGGHTTIPWFEGPSWEHFFQRHLSGTGKSGVVEAA